MKQRKTRDEMQNKQNRRKNFSASGDSMFDNQIKASENDGSDKSLRNGGDKLEEMDDEEKRESINQKETKQKSKSENSKNEKCESDLTAECVQQTKCMESQSKKYEGNESKISFLNADKIIFQTKKQLLEHCCRIPPLLEKIETQYEKMFKLGREVLIDQKTGQNLLQKSDEDEYPHKSESKVNDISSGKDLIGKIGVVMMRLKKDYRKLKVKYYSYVYRKIIPENEIYDSVENRRKCAPEMMVDLDDWLDYPVTYESQLPRKAKQEMKTQRNYLDQYKIANRTFVRKRNEISNLLAYNKRIEKKLETTNCVKSNSTKTETLIDRMQATEDTRRIFLQSIFEARKSLLKLHLANSKLLNVNIFENESFNRLIEEAVATSTNLDQSSESTTYEEDDKIDQEKF